MATSKDGKRTKPPLQPNGWAANHSNPETWSTFDDVRSAWQKKPHFFDGLGFVLLSKEDGIVGIDLDHCRDPKTGKIADWAMKIVRDMKSYTEVSPSKTGLKIFVKADLVPDFPRKKLTIAKTDGPDHNEQIEVYLYGYFTVTGESLEETPDEITDATEALERLAYRLAAEGAQHPTERAKPAKPPGNHEAAKRPNARAKPAGSIPSLPPPPQDWGLSTIKDDEAFASLADLGVDIDRNDDLSESTLASINKGANLRDLWKSGTPPKSMRDTSASSLDMSLASRLDKYNVPPQQIVSALWQFQHGQAVKMNAGEFRRQIARILFKILKSDNDKQQRQEELESSFAGEVEVVPGEFAREVDQSIDILAPTKTIFKRGNMLVQPVHLSEATASDHGIRMPKGALTISGINAHTMYYQLAKNIGFYAEYTTPDGETKRSYGNPPEQIGPVILNSPHLWEPFQQLISVSEVPLITPEGRIISESGVDPTGVLFHPGATKFDHIPGGEAEPGQADAIRALAYLDKIICGFPYVDEAARSTMLAAMLTIYCRPFLRSCPMFVFTAPKMGSGKSLQTSILGYMATGKSPAMMSQANDEESERKRVLALLLQGSPVSVIDNIERPLKSDVMCTVLTESMYTDRLLGHSKNVSVPTNTIWCATGNNIAVQGDLTTRGLVVMIDPECERPEERRFDLNLHQWVPENRATIASACLTILKAYIVAGRPMTGELTVFGRFESWSQMVREPLAWLGLTDPYQSKSHLETHDPDREVMNDLMRYWHAIFGTRPTTIAAALETIQKVGPSQKDERYLALEDAFMALMPPSAREINRRSLGKRFKKNENRIENRLKITRGDDYKNTAQWRVEEVS